MELCKLTINTRIIWHGNYVLEWLKTVNIDHGSLEGNGAYVVGSYLHNCNCDNNCNIFSKCGMNMS